MISRWFLVMAFCLSAIAAGMAQGGPPMRTDDPGTLGKGNWEINIAATADPACGREGI
jgi:hypothetical protein